MVVINGKHIDLHDFLENDGVECFKCGMEISDLEVVRVKDKTYCSDCALAINVFNA